MLARLARWLRVLGWDTTLDPDLDDPELVRRANSQDRILLTRDRHLLRELKPLRSHEVRSDQPLEQLRDVVQSLELPAPAELFTRCTVCNTPLSAPLAPEARATLLPPDVRDLPGPACWNVTAGFETRTANKQGVGIADLNFEISGTVGFDNV